jgi:hypothetical protein
MISFPLLLAEATKTSRFEFARVQYGFELWACGGVLLVLLLLSFMIYRRDAGELPIWLRVLLAALRAIVFIGLAVVWLQPQYRNETEQVHESRVLMLLDTSLSMNRIDIDPSVHASGQTRLQQVAAGLDSTDFLARLREKHEVSVFTFNDALEREKQVVLPKIRHSEEAGKSASADASQKAGAHDSAVPPAGTVASGTPSSAPVSWRTRLEPGGSETRLGEALDQLIRDQRNSPVSGIILASDGGQNAGAPPENAIELAREAHIPVFTVGVGSEKRPTTVRVADFRVPSRAFPGDKFVMHGSIQGRGQSGITVDVQLYSREGDAAKDPTQRGHGALLATKSVALGTDGELVPVQFEQTPDKLGPRTYCLRVVPPQGDLSQEEKFLEAEVDVVDRKNRVLLIASGPMRDYQYLRGALFRDKSMTVDVYLQTAQPGMSQESGKLLDEFPTKREELFNYDCIIGFDPDWTALKPEQVDLLEKWVGDEGGGLIVVAGPVFAGRGADSWVQDPTMNKIRNLYPVEFNRSIAMRGNVFYGSEEPWPLDFTREGRRADYLWLGDTYDASLAAWLQMQGVYSFCPVRAPKAAASVLARFSDPRTAQGDKQPPYFVEQFYGAGRVFYMASGETWRLRRADPDYFDQLWTKLIRHISQGRLMRQSSRGTLLLGQDRYVVGNSVEVRAQLTAPNLGPLIVPGVTVQVRNNGLVQKPVALVPDPSRAGMYQGQFQVLREGEYRLDLPVPNSGDEKLTRSFRVSVPKLEEENPQRNTALLKEIAAKTGGVYYDDLMAAMRSATKPPLVDKLPDVTRTELVPEDANPETQREWLQWMMIGLLSLLCVEWLIRRLAKLA